jgi:hypothetical protein
MHRFSHLGPLIRLRLAALLLVLKWLLIPLTIGFVIYALVALVLENDTFLIPAAQLVAFTIVLCLFEWGITGRCRCPLCLGLLLRNSGSVRNRNCRHLWGSYRLRVVTDMFFKGVFRCPHCGESCLMEVRDPKRSSRSHSQSVHRRSRRS